MSALNNPTPKGRSLLPIHEKILKERAIPIDFAVTHNLFSLDEDQWRRWHKHSSGPQRLPYHEGCSGLVIPYTTTADFQESKRVRVRLDQTERTVQEEPATRSHCCGTIELPRYISQAGLGVAPYIIRDVLKVAGDTTVPLYVVEAPLKALCLSAHAMLAIGLGGVLAGCHDKQALADLDEVVAHPELKRIKWNGRRVYIVFDAGISNADNHEGNPLVALGAARVWKTLADLGADVWLATIPYYHPQDSDPERGQVWWGNDQGPDDFIARNGLDAFTKLIDDAVPADPAKRFEAQLLGLGPAERAEAIDQLLGDLFVQASLKVASKAKLSSLATRTKSVGVGVTDLRAIVQEFDARVVRRVRKDEPKWKNDLVCSSSGLPRPITQNVEIALRCDPALAGLISFNEFSQEVVFCKQPPWIEQYRASKSVVAGSPWSDADDTRLANYLGVTHSIIDVLPAKLKAAVDVVARDRPVHPVRDYLSSLEWDGNKRVDDWLVKYMGVEDTPYCRQVGRWWPISAVARVMNPGCKADHTLIFEGEQGVMKSSALQVLGGDWFSDADLGDLKNKEAALVLQGLWIVELPEGEIFSRASSRQLKAFTTKLNDDLIPKHSNRRVRLPRQCVFALTTNDEADYLNDSSGNRRYWPVRCIKVDLDGLREFRDQLWAEAVALHQAGEKWWPVTEEEKALCKGEQALRKTSHPWEDRIREGVRHLQHVTIGSVLGAIIGLAAKDQTRKHQLDAGKCLRAIGWHAPDEVRKNSVRVWVRGPDAEPIHPDEISEEDLGRIIEGKPNLRVVPADEGGDDSLPGTNGAASG